MLERKADRETLERQLTELRADKEKLLRDIQEEKQQYDGAKKALETLSSSQVPAEPDETLGELKQEKEGLEKKVKRRSSFFFFSFVPQLLILWQLLVEVPPERKPWKGSRGY